MQGPARDSHQVRMQRQHEAQLTSPAAAAIFRALPPARTGLPVPQLVHLVLNACTVRSVTALAGCWVLLGEAPAGWREDPPLLRPTAPCAPAS